MYCLYGFFFFKQKTAYEMRISDWSSDVCSSDLPDTPRAIIPVFGRYDTLFTLPERNHTKTRVASATVDYEITPAISLVSATSYSLARNDKRADYTPDYVDLVPAGDKVQFVYGLKTKKRTEKHTSELQSLMRI